MREKTSIYAIRTTIGQERSVTDLVTTAVEGEKDIWACPYCSEQFSSEIITRTHMERCSKKKEGGTPRLVSKNPLLGRVKAILVPETLRGYVFIETEEFRDVEIAISGVPHVRGRVGGKVSLDEIDKFLIPKPAAEGIDTGDVIEIISGPFKGERARVSRVDTAKEELILEMLTSNVPIRVHADFAKLVEKGRASDTLKTSSSEVEDTEKDDDKLF